MGKASRDKGARSERALRDELTRYGWEGATRVPLSGAMKTRVEYQSDVTARPPGYGSEVTFENKARATGFDAYYALLPRPESVIAVAFESGESLVVTLNPNIAIEAHTHLDISEFDPKFQKALRSIAKKCREWIGTAMILSMKQDRKPFIYVRYRK